MRSFEEDLSRAITFHGHLCGGQITGVRMARYALKYFGIEDPDHYRDLIVYVECDRCLTDAIMVVTGCHPGKRRMKCLDFGKQAATFFDMNRNEAIRLVNVSEKCPKGEDAKAWFATRSDEDLFSVQEVVVNYTDLDAPGKPHSHAIAQFAAKRLLMAVKCRQAAERLSAEVVPGRLITKCCRLRE